MNIRYFFIKDRLKSEGIEVVYCPTGKMIADFFTKPLQGLLFRKFRDVVLGYIHISKLKDEPAKRDLNTNQEFVGCNLLTETKENVKNDKRGFESENVKTGTPLHTPNNKTITWADVVIGKK